MVRTVTGRRRSRSPIAAQSSSHRSGLERNVVQKMCIPSGHLAMPRLRPGLATSASAQQATLQSVLEGLPQSCPQLPVRSAISEHLNAFYQARQFQPA